MITVGIDPDSNKHGVAIYQDLKLVELVMLNNIEIFYQYLMTHKAEDILFSIENVCANNFVYARNNKEKKSIVSQIAMKVGRCQQSQIELMRWLDSFKMTYILHKPQAGNWAKNKAQFKKATGWTAQSNEDTRSAAYFGYLALK